MGFNINGPVKGQIAFTPGQGSQSIGMMTSFREFQL